MICNVIANGKIPVIGGYRTAYGVDLTDSDIDRLMQFINSGTRVYVADTGQLITPENIDEILGRSSGGGGTVDSGALLRSINANTEAGGIKSGTIFQAGTTNEALWNSLLVSYKPPTVTFNQNSESKEFGESYGTLTLSADVTRNSKSIQSVIMKKNNEVIKTFDNVTAGGTFTTTLNTSSDSASFSVSVVVSDGSTNVTKTANKSFSSSGFFGASTTDQPFTTSAEIRSLNKKQNIVKGDTFTINIPVGSRTITISYPASLGDITSVKFVESLNAEIKSAFVKSTVNVEGANGATAIPYNVYTQVSPVEFNTISQYDVTI